MRLRPNRRWWVVCSWLIATSFGHAAPWERPGGFKSVDASVLRDQAVGELDRFAKAYSGTPVAAEAAKLAAAHGPSSGDHAWVAATLAWAERGLKAHPPSKENAKVRRAILSILDYPLHVDPTHMGTKANGKLNWAEEVGTHYQRLVGPAVREIAASKTTSGLDVWKLYNMGFVVRSENHCVGFDIHPGFFRRPYPLTASQRRALVDRLEVLFVSHDHLDHLSSRFVQRMLDGGKKVVLPTPVRRNLTHPSIVRLYDNGETPTDIGGIKVYSFPGWQGRLTPVSVYAVNLDGYWVAHNGDNLRTQIYQGIPDRCAVDVLLANCWSGVGVFMAWTRPRLTLTGHENEMGHPVALRVAYRTTYAYLDMVRALPPCRVLHWGERVHWEP